MLCDWARSDSELTDEIVRGPFAVDLGKFPDSNEKIRLVYQIARIGPPAAGSEPTPAVEKAPASEPSLGKVLAPEPIVGQALAPEPSAEKILGPRLNSWFRRAAEPEPEPEPMA